MSDVIIPYEFLCRGGTAAAVAAWNGIPRSRQMIIETDTGRFKVGDGTTHYNDLPYFAGPIGDLSDVNAPSPTNGQALIFDLATGKWVPGPGAVSAGSQIGYARTTSATTATTTSSIPLDNTIPQNSEGAAYAALDTTITPQDSSSLLVIDVDIPLVSASTTTNLAFALFRDSGADAIAATFVAIEAADRGRQLRLRAIVSAGSTAATTFKLRWGTSAGTGALLRTNGTAAFLGGVIAATMSVREIKQ